MTATDSDQRRLASSELREEVRAWLADNWDPDLEVTDWWRVVAEAGWTAPHFTPEQGGRGLHRRASATVRSAFAALRGIASARRARSPDGRTNDPDPRDPGTGRTTGPPDPRRSCRLVPALQRAGSGIGSRRAHHPCGPRRRSMDHQRPEGVEQSGARVGLRHAARPDRSRSTQAPRDLVVRLSTRSAGSDDPAAPGDDGRRGVQRGVHRQRRVRRRRSHRR